MVKYDITKNNLHIYDSALVPKAKYGRNLVAIKGQHPDSEVWNRKMCSLKLEWASHSFLYSIGLWKSHTKDVDLNYPQKWYITLGYCLFGLLVWIFVD